ncbi:hypothetical protein UQ35_19510, partial [Escherichia coli]
GPEASPPAAVACVSWTDDGRTGYGQTNGCGQNGGIKFTHNYLSLFCNKKGAISGARIWVIKFS